ncbi:MAG: ATP-dependent dethiobiotin synthetase BioD [Turneriella sp.]|nr:ATP-dependent dethiobiotin synthetase BioD [Turneriella sp.]
MAIFVVGSGTNVGKTIFSAATMLLYAHEKKILYLKPIQTGIESDTETVKSLSMLEDSFFLHPLYRFSFAASPHLAAEKENKKISTEYLVKELCTKKKTHTIIELAGGLMVPLTRTPYFTNLDLILQVKAPCVLVAGTSLGTINHTLLTYNTLLERGVICRGIFFVTKKEKNENTDGLKIREDNIATIMEIVTSISPEIRKPLGHLVLPYKKISAHDFKSLVIPLHSKLLQNSLL